MSISERVLNSTMDRRRLLTGIDDCKWALDAIFDMIYREYIVVFAFAFWPNNNNNLEFKNKFN